ILVACDSGRILHTEDAGAHWSIVQTESGERIDCISMADTLNGIAGGNASGILATADGGVTWIRVPKPDTISRKGTLDMICFAPKVYFVLTNRRDIIRTEDGGAHWRVYGNATGGFRLAAVTSQLLWVAGDSLTGLGAQARDIIRVTRDSGATWQAQVDSLIPAAFGLNDIAFADSLNGIAAGQVGKVLRTTDGGRTWRQEQVHLDAQLIAVIYPTPTTALIVSNEGNILKQERTITAVRGQRDADANELRVLPNPVTGDGARIRYRIRQPGAVRITLNDMLGRCRTLAEEENLTAGEHVAALPDGLPAGIYIVRMQSGTMVTTATCIVQH
ncbi:MAG TPA: YCF48-related protein, partial [Candidatus Kapabacteria bacterium]|nr:YCF48-related protein [Candidatus Kapabacteria bacterium]